ncbi:NnrS family protein [Hydrogenimonas sp.]
MQQFTPEREQPSRFSYFLSQPHQPFFLMGIVWAAVTVLLFMLGYRGALPFSVDTALFHAYAMLFIVLTHFFHGFLLTTLPRFCMSAPVPRPIYTRLFTLYEAGSLLFLAGALLSFPLAIAGMLLLLSGHLLIVGHFRQIFRSGGAPDKKDPFWLLIAHASGLVAHLLFVAGFALDAAGVTLAWQSTAVGTGFYLYIIFLTFTVAQRMIPFFSHVMIARPNRFLLFVYALFALKTLLFAASFTIAEAVVTLVLAGYLLREFLRWRLPVFSSPAILWVLHLGLFWLPAGLAIEALTLMAGIWLQTSFIFAGMHLIAIGFVVTILIGFGTRVTLGHSGQVPHADRLSIALFWLTEVVVLSRFLYSLAMGFGLDLQWLFDLSAGLWILLFTLWGVRFGPILFRGKKEQ